MTSISGLFSLMLEIASFRNSKLLFMVKNCSSKVDLNSKHSSTLPTLLTFISLKINCSCRESQLIRLAFSCSNLRSSSAGQILSSFIIVSSSRLNSSRVFNASSISLGLDFIALIAIATSLIRFCSITKQASNWLSACFFFYSSSILISSSVLQNMSVKSL